MDYIIVSAVSSQELVSKVKNEISKGFIPIGGISCTTTVPLKFYQSMIKGD